MPELGLSSTYDYSTAPSNRKKSIFLVIGVTSASAHSLSHPHAENRSPNDDEGAEIGHFLRIRPCVLDVRYVVTKV